MPEKTLKTRIKLRYDTLANWETNNPVLLAGEIGIATVPDATDPIHNAPAVVVKVGEDGVKAWKDLNYMSALAADVYGWAKAATKPTYTADEITGVAKPADIEKAIQALDSNAAVQSGKFITGFDVVDGKVTNVQYGAPAEITIPSYTLAAGKTEGTYTLNKDGSPVSEDIKITGWNTLVAKADAAYVKPEGGIPKTDLDASVQASLAKADSAIQDISGKVDKVVGTVGNFVSFGAEGAIADSGKKADDFEATGVAAGLVSTHNSAGDAHSDIRASITALQETVGTLGNALHFAGAGTTLPEEGKDGDVYVVTEGENAGKEYIWANDGWQEFGDTSDYLLATTAAATYVPKTTTINNKKLDANITLTAGDVGADPAGTAQGLIDGLDVTVEGAAANKTLATLTEVDGKIAATFQEISITNTQVSGLGTLATKNSVGDAEITGVAMSKVTGLSDALDGKADDSEITTITGRLDTLEAKPGLDKVGTVTSVATTPNGGLKITGNASVNPTIDIDDSIVFVFDCGTSVAQV